jgi:hypothetical protein
MTKKKPKPKRVEPPVAADPPWAGAKINGSDIIATITSGSVPRQS